MRPAPAVSSVRRVVVGACEVFALPDGCLLDRAGAVVGPVPARLWRSSADDGEDPIIRLPVYAFVVRSAKDVILVDTGCGEVPGPENDLMRPPGPVRRALHEIGLAAGDVTLVINSHLHSDHAGGNTIRRRGRWEPAFPNARYCIQRAEWAYSQNPAPLHRDLYREELSQPLAEAGVLRLLDGEVQLADSVRCLPAPGHTPGHQVVAVESEGSRALLLGDAATIRWQFLRPSWSCPFDLDPRVGTTTKQAIHRRLGGEPAWLGFAHDEVMVWGPRHARRDRTEARK